MELTAEQKITLKAPALKPNVQKIKELCKAHGFSVTYLCNQIGTSSSYFGDVKLGKTKVPRWRMDKICEVLNTTYEYLLDISDSPTPEPNRISPRPNLQALIDTVNAWDGRADEDECYELLIALAKKL